MHKLHSVLQCVAVLHRVLQCVAVLLHSVLQCTNTQYSTNAHAHSACAIYTILSIARILNKHVRNTLVLSIHARKKHICNTPILSIMQILNTHIPNSPQYIANTHKKKTYLQYTDSQYYANTQQTYLQYTGPQYIANTHKKETYLQYTDFFSILPI